MVDAFEVFKQASVKSGSFLFSVSNAISNKVGYSANLIFIIFILIISLILAWIIKKGQRDIWFYLITAVFFAFFYFGGKVI